MCSEQPLIYGFLHSIKKAVTPVSALSADAYLQDTSYGEIITHLNNLFSNFLWISKTQRDSRVTLCATFCSKPPTSANCLNADELLRIWLNNSYLATYLDYF